MPTANAKPSDRLLPYAKAFTVKARLEDDGKERVYPVYRLMEFLLYIETDRRSEDGRMEIRRFELNDGQVELYRSMAELAQQGRPVRVDVLKARQIGYSTFIAGFFFILWAFGAHEHYAVVADQKEHAENIFKKYEVFYKHLDDSNPHAEECRAAERRKARSPHTWKPALSTSRGQKEYETEHGESSIEVIVAGDQAGRSAHYTGVHYSECAFFKDFAATTNSLNRTVSSNPNTYIFYETTANGPNAYKRVWDGDVAGDTQFLPLFSNWLSVAQNRKTLYPGQKTPIFPRFMLERQRKFGADQAQMLWYWDRFVESARDEQLTLQEYPWCPEDAFMATGASVFGSQETAQRKAELLRSSKISRKGWITYSMKSEVDSQNSEHYSLEGVGFRPDPNGPLRIFEEPIDGHPYVAVCDPNNERNDDSAIVVMDNSNGRQVAAFSTNQLGWRKVGCCLYVIGQLYNWALISVEMNVGHAVMETVLRLSYPIDRIYREQRLVTQDFRETMETRYGHVTSPATRPLMLSYAKQAFADDPHCVCDLKTVMEMETFQKVEHDRNGRVTFKEEALPGCHDDLVMAWAGFYLVRAQQDFRVAEQERKTKPKEIPLEVAWERKRAEALRKYDGNASARTASELFFGGGE